MHKYGEKILKIIISQQKKIIELGFDGIDINMGCPVKKIVKHGVCSALIENQSLALEIIKAVKEGTKGKIPVSIKTRIGYSKNVVEEWANFLLKTEIDALTIHGRTAKQKSKVPANWNEIKKVVEIRNELKKKTVIIGNGDILSLKDGYERAKVYGVDGIMIGRGIFTDPLIFNSNKSFESLNFEEKIQMLKKHVELYKKYFEDKKSYAHLKRFFKIYIRGFDGAGELRRRLMETYSFEEFYSVIS